MERLFQILAVVLIGIAAFLLWQGITEWVFPVAVIGSVCFFLSVRFQIKEKMKSSDAGPRQDSKTEK